MKNKINDILKQFDENKIKEVYVYFTDGTRIIIHVDDDYWRYGY